MAQSFTDIKIKGFDDAASGPSGSGSLMRLVFRLSHSAPRIWSDYFNAGWDQHIYMMKRGALVSGDRLEIIAMPDELQKDHLPELNKIIAQTNSAYGAYVAKQNQNQQQVDEEAKRRRDELAALKNNLKFDE